MKLKLMFLLHPILGVVQVVHCTQDLHGRLDSTTLSTHLFRRADSPGDQRGGRSSSPTPSISSSLRRTSLQQATSSQQRSSQNQASSSHSVPLSFHHELALSPPSLPQQGAFPQQGVFPQHGAFPPQMWPNYGYHPQQAWPQQQAFPPQQTLPLAYGFYQPSHPSMIMPLASSVIQPWSPAQATQSQRTRNSGGGRRRASNQASSSQRTQNSNQDRKSVSNQASSSQQTLRSPEPEKLKGTPNPVHISIETKGPADISGWQGEKPLNMPSRIRKGEEFSLNLMHPESAMVRVDHRSKDARSQLWASSKYSRVLGAWEHNGLGRDKTVQVYTPGKAGDVGKKASPCFAHTYDLGSDFREYKGPGCARLLTKHAYYNKSDENGSEDPAVILGSFRGSGHFDVDARNPRTRR